MNLSLQINSTGFCQITKLCITPTGKFCFLFWGLFSPFLFVFVILSLQINSIIVYQITKLCIIPTDNKMKIKSILPTGKNKNSQKSGS